MRDNTTIVNIDKLITTLTTLTNSTDEGFIKSLEKVYSNRGNDKEIIEDITCGGVDLGEKGTFYSKGNEYLEQLQNMLKYFKEIKKANQVSKSTTVIPYTPTDTTALEQEEENIFDDTSEENITPTDSENTETSSIGTYTIRKGTIDVYDENGHIIGTIGAGSYTVYAAKYDDKGNIIAIRISKDGEPEQWIYLKSDTSDAYYTELGQVGSYTTNETKDIYDENGNIIGTIGAGTYTVYETKYDDKGNVIAVRISKDGEPEQWIHLNPIDVNSHYNEVGQVGTYTLREGTLDVYDEKGNKVGTITSGSYTVYETKYDSNGNVIAVRISKDGEPEQWIYINNPNANGSYVEVGQVGTYTNLTETTPIYNENGEAIGTVTGGTYKIYAVKYDEKGNIIAVRISKDGEPEQWIYINDPNIKGYYIEVGQMGYYTLHDGTLNVYDANGNLIDTITPGQYKVYEVKYDVGGNVIAIRISPPGEAERWVYININNQDGTYNPIDNQKDVTNDEDGKAILNLYNKKNSHLLGILGILAIIIGTGFLLKKKLKKKNEKNENEEEYEDKYLETDINPGEYNIYEINRDNDNNVKEVRITNNNDDNDLWLEL